MPKKRFDRLLPWRSAKRRVAALASERRLPSRQLVELLSRVLLDRQLRDALFADPEAVSRAFDLGPDETQMVKRLDRQRLEQRVAVLRSA